MATLHKEDWLFTVIDAKSSVVHNRVENQQPQPEDDDNSYAIEMNTCNQIQISKYYIR